MPIFRSSWALVLSVVACFLVGWYGEMPAGVAVVNICVLVCFLLGVLGGLLVPFWGNYKFGDAAGKVFLCLLWSVVAAG